MVVDGYYSLYKMTSAYVDFFTPDSFERSNII